jgi:hypothetical protein
MALNVHDSTRAEAAKVRTYRARWEELKQIRAPFEPEWQQIADYTFPRRNFILTEDSKGLNRRRRLFDTTAMIAHERCSATIYGYLISPHSPWTRPELLNRDFTYAEDSWADEVARRMHRNLSSAQSSFAVQLAEDVDDATGFGSSAIWQQPSRAALGSHYLSVPLKQVWVAENEMGIPWEHHRQFRMSARRAMERYPKATALRERMRHVDRPEAIEVSFLHVMEPRPGGVRGDLREIKPWTDIIIDIDGQEVIEIGGHDRKPLNFGRFKRRPGETYGHGPGWTALGLAKLANAILESYVRNAELIADPVLMSFMPRGTRLDRRPGAVNTINTLMTQGMRDPKDVVQRLQLGGDISVADGLLRTIWNKIDQAYYIDWITPREGPQQTATEVLDRRDLRLRSLGPVVARLEHEKMTVIAENAYEDMMAAGLLPQPPASLDGELMTFDYLGPLALAQRQGEVEGLQRFMAMAVQMAQVTQDPLIGRMVQGERSMRAVGDALGVPSRLLSSPEDMQSFRDGQREAGEMQEQMAAAESAARAAQAGGQGLLNLSKVGAAA